MKKENQNNTNNFKEKKNYKKAPLMPIHLRVFMAVLLGQIACGFALGISVQLFLTLVNISKLMIFGLD